MIFNECPTHIIQRSEQYQQSLQTKPELPRTHLGFFNIGNIFVFVVTYLACKYEYGHGGKVRKHAKRMEVAKYTISSNDRWEYFFKLKWSSSLGRA